MSVSLKGKLWLTYCAWFRPPLDNKIKEDFAAQLPPWSEFHIEIARFLAATGQSNVPMRELYMLMRGLKPEVVIETGVGRGGSSATILAAMDKNQKGELHSIDATEHRDPKENDGYTPDIIGNIVGVKEHPRWKFHKGLSYDILPNLLKELAARKKTVGLFIHDSDHGEKCVEFELFTAAPGIAPGGFLASHDSFAFGNKPAFRKFEREKKDFSMYFEGKGGEYRIYRKQQS